MNNKKLCLTKLEGMSSFGMQLLAVSHICQSVFVVWQSSHVMTNNHNFQPQDQKVIFIIYSRTSLSGHSDKRTHSLERTKF